LRICKQRLRLIEIESCHHPGGELFTAVIECFFPGFQRCDGCLVGIERAIGIGECGIDISLKIELGLVVRDLIPVARYF
jgi:hypothetical protein